MFVTLTNIVNQRVHSSKMIFKIVLTNKITE